MAKARDILLRLTADPTDAKRGLGQVEHELKKIDSMKVEARAEIATAGAKAQLDRLNVQLERLGKQEVTPAVQIKTAKTLEQIERIEKKLAGIKDQTVHVKVREQENVRVRQTAHIGSDGLRLGSGIGVAGLAGRAGPIGLAAGAAVGGAVIGIKSVTTAAAEAEASQARLRAQLKASNISYKEHAAAIDDVIQKTSKLSGLDDEDLQDVFSGLVRSTGNVGKSLKDLGTVADIARAKQISVAAAGKILEKAHQGNVGSLKKLGIAIDPVTSHLDALKKSTDNATPAQIKQAKELDKQATATKALGTIQERFAGQAKAYGDTAGGAQDKFRVATENLRESIGSGLTPILADLAQGAVKAVEAIQANFPKIKHIIGDVIAAVRTFFRRNRGDINNLVHAFGNIGKAVRHVFEDVVLPAIRAVLPGIKSALGGIVRIARGVIRTFSALFNGDFKGVLDGLKDIVDGAMKTLRGAFRAGLDLAVKTIRGLGGSFLGAGRSLGRALVNGIRSIFTGGVNLGIDLGKSLGNALVKLLNDLIPNSIDAGIANIDLPNNPIKKKFARGGLVGGSGVGDTVAAMLTPGEFVLNRRAVQSIGLANVAALNAGRGGIGRDGAGHTFHIHTPSGGHPDERIFINRISRELGRRP